MSPYTGRNRMKFLLMMITLLLCSLFVLAHRRGVLSKPRSIDVRSESEKVRSTQESSGTGSKADETSALSAKHRFDFQTESVPSSAQKNFADSTGNAYRRL